MPKATEIDRRTEVRIAVFGSSEPAPGEPLYEEARRLGALLASSGHSVVTGGYGGVMEGASRGALESGGKTIGVVCSVFETRSPNRYLTEVVPSRDLHDRTRLLIELAHGFVVLKGKSGTLAELTFLWALHRAGCLGGPPVVLLGTCWPPLVRHLREGGLLEEAEAVRTRLVATPEDAVRVLVREVSREDR